MSTITMHQIDKAVEMLRDAEPESLRHTVTRSHGHAAIVHAFGASALGTADEFDECLLHHVGLSPDAYLSERAIALIMWERTRAQVCSLKYEMYKELYQCAILDHSADDTREAFVGLIIGWEYMLRQANRYLTARGWEPLP